ncbi:MAG: transposase [Planctomycetes bacterium]|nr:transposase [Planctomycetota bacterium]
MAEPLAYLITWTTYGTWLPGDERGWVEEDTPGIQEAARRRAGAARGRMKEPPVTLDPEQRVVVEATVRAHCDVRHWPLHAVNARTNHIHVVVTAPETDPETVMDQFKAWCSRRLNECDAARGVPRRQRWWTHHGSTKWINDEDYFHNAICYVLERQ